MLYSIIVKILLFYPILIIIDRFFTKFGALMIYIELFLTVGILVLKNKKSVIKYFFIVIIFLFSFFFTTNFKLHLEYIRNLMISLAIFDICLDRDILKVIKKEMIKNKRILFWGILLNFFINIVLFFSSKGYSSMYGDAWGTRAFNGIYVDPHQLAYRTIAILILTLFYIRITSKKIEKNMLIGLSTIGCLFILMSGARVPLILAAIIELYILKSLNIKFTNTNLNNKEKIFLMTILLLICIVVIILLSETAFWKKTINSLNNLSFDNGRGALQKIDIEYFKSLNIINKLFGIGNEKSYELHMRKFAAYIWSHNDFTQILNGNGIIILIIYIYSLFNLRKIEMENKFLFMLSIFFVAWKNGLYVHTSVVFSFIALAISFLESKSENINKSEKKI